MQSKSLYFSVMQGIQLSSCLSEDALVDTRNSTPRPSGGSCSDHSRRRCWKIFEEDDAVPFMMQLFQIREEKRAAIPAVTSTARAACRRLCAHQPALLAPDRRFPRPHRSFHPCLPHLPRDGQP